MGLKMGKEIVTLYLDLQYMSLQPKYLKFWLKKKKKKSAYNKLPYFSTNFLLLFNKIYCHVQY